MDKALVKLMDLYDQWAEEERSERERAKFLQFYQNTPVQEEPPCNCGVGDRGDWASHSHTCPKYRK